MSILNTLDARLLDALDASPEQHPARVTRHMNDSARRPETGDDPSPRHAPPQSHPKFSQLGDSELSEPQLSDSQRHTPLWKSSDFLLRSSLMGAVLLLDLLLFPLTRIGMGWENLLAPIFVLVFFGTTAIIYERRGAPQFVLISVACLQLMIFTSAFTLLMYSAASLARPLADSALLACDMSLGLSTLACWQWAQANPRANLLLNLAYHSVTPQMLLLVLVLGMRLRRAELSSFVLRYMVCLLLTVSIFALFPAEGPFVAPEFTPNAMQESYLAQLRGTRDGSLTRISLAEAEGLITFPSFHTSLAIILALSAAGMGWLRWPLVVVNLLVMVATVTSGWHYATDVVAGAAIAWISVRIAGSLNARFGDVGKRPQLMPCE